MLRSILGALLILLLAGAAPRRKESSCPARRPRAITSAAWASPAYGMGSYNLTHRAGQSDQHRDLHPLERIRRRRGQDPGPRARRATRGGLARRQEATTQLHKRRLENPESFDVLKGDALNDVLKQLTIPEDLRIELPLCARSHVPADVIRQIPFMLAEDKARFSMNRLTMKGKGKWPVAFQDPRFALYLRSYQDRPSTSPWSRRSTAKLTKEAIADVQASRERPARKLDAEFPPSQDTRYIEAKQRLEELDATVELLKKHKVELAIGELEQYSGHHGQRPEALHAEAWLAVRTGQDAGREDPVSQAPCVTRRATREARRRH